MYFGKDDYFFLPPPPHFIKAVYDLKTFPSHYMKQKLVAKGKKSRWGNETVFRNSTI